MKRTSFCAVVFLFVVSFTNTLSLYAKDIRPSKPSDQEVCFSPDEPCAEKLIHFINSAKKSIDIAIYSINIEGVVDALIKKAGKIKVRVVCDKLQAHGTRSQVRHLLENGVDIRYGKQKGIMHNKFVIIDNEMIETGSFNYTNHAMTSNQENQIYLSNPSIVTRFMERFDLIWETSVEISLREILEEIQFEESVEF